MVLMTMLCVYHPFILTTSTLAYRNFCNIKQLKVFTSSGSIKTFVAPVAVAEASMDHL